MIVRLMGEGQYRVDDELEAALGDLDDQAVAALGRSDEPELDRFLDEMWELVRARGTRLADDVLFSADRLATIVPVIGIVLLGAAIIFGFSLSPVLQLIAVGALLSLGPAVFSSIMGAELP